MQRSQSHSKMKTITVYPDHILPDHWLKLFACTSFHLICEISLFAAKFIFTDMSKVYLNVGNNNESDLLLRYSSIYLNVFIAALNSIYI